MSSHNKGVKSKTVLGLLWTFSQQFSVQLINVIVGLVLARILMPSVFGLIGMLAVFIAIGNTLMDSGMTSSLIRTKEADQRDYSTIFYINVTFSVLLYFILFFIAPLIAKFYQQPILTSVVRVYTLSFIITAFVSVQTTKLTKEMRFKEQMLMQVPSTIIGGALGVVLAYNDFGVWSIVWMNLAQSSLFAIQHWIFSGWTPSLVFDYEKFRYHFRFGYKLTFSGLIDTVYTNIYKILIGKYFSATELGYFSQAQSLQMLPVSNISTALNKVTYPLFSSINDDEDRLRIVYRKILHQVIFWVAPMMILAIVIAKPLFHFLLTDKWMPAVPYFQILCLTGILYPFHAYNLNVLNVKGRSDLFLKLEVIKKVFITVGIGFAIMFGIYGLLIFQVISSIFAFWVNTFYSGKFLGYSGFQQFKEISPSLVISIFSGIVSWVVLNKLNIYYSLPSWLLLLIILFLYILLYLFFSKYFKIEALNDFKLLIFKR